MRNLLIFVSSFLSVTLYCGLAFAESTGDKMQVVDGSNAAFYFGMTVLAAGIGIAIATMLTGLGQGKAIEKAVEGMARQPEAAPKIQTAMIIGLAFIESLVIYALLIALILLFLNPFAKYFVAPPV